MATWSAVNSRHLVDPELLPFLDALPAFELSAEILPAVRAAVFPHPVDPTAAAAVEMTQHTVPGPKSAPDVAVVIYRPRQSNASLPCIFHMHGGGYVAGSAASLEPLHRSLALAAQCVIVAVDYRLAPETRFPGAVEDCYAALNWTFNHVNALGIDAQRIGVMGESAGGGLAASLALLTRDRREYTLAFQHLIYPMLDDQTCIRKDPHPYTGEILWTPHNNVFGWTSLLGVAPGSDNVSPYAAPARAQNLSGLPPTYISTGALDLFLEEDIEYARRLSRHGVSVELHVYPGAYHGFDLLPGTQVGQNASRDSLAALRRSLQS